MICFHPRRPAALRSGAAYIFMGDSYQPHIGKILGKILGEISVKYFLALLYNIWLVYLSVGRQNDSYLKHKTITGFPIYPQRGAKKQERKREKTMILLTEMPSLSTPEI